MTFDGLGPWTSFAIGAAVALAVTIAFLATIGTLAHDPGAEDPDVSIPSNDSEDLEATDDEDRNDTETTELSHGVDKPTFVAEQEGDDVVVIVVDPAGEIEDWGFDCGQPPERDRSDPDHLETVTVQDCNRTDLTVDALTDDTAIMVADGRILEIGEDDFPSTETGGESDR